MGKHPLFIIDGTFSLVDEHNVTSTRDLYSHLRRLIE